MVGIPSRRSGSGRDTFPEVRKWSGDPPEGFELVGEHSGGTKLVWNPPKGPEEVEGPSRRFGIGLGTIPEVRKWSGTLPEVRNWSGDPPGGLKVVEGPSRGS